MSFDNKVNCLRDFWFKFDSLLVTFMVLETWIMPAFTSGASGGNYYKITDSLFILYLNFRCAK